MTAYMIDDGVNWFDEWNAEREALGFTDDKFAWSPDDGCPIWADDEARLKYESLTETYAQYCREEPTVTAVQVKKGAFTLKTELAPNAVVFFEVRQ